MAVPNFQQWCFQNIAEITAGNRATRNCSIHEHGASAETPVTTTGILANFLGQETERKCINHLSANAQFLAEAGDLLIGGHDFIKREFPATIRSAAVRANALHLHIINLIPQCKTWVIVSKMCA